jgi:hypothetical protein
MQTRRKGLFDGMLKYWGLWHAEEADLALTTATDTIPATTSTEGAVELLVMTAKGGIASSPDDVTSNAVAAHGDETVETVETVEAVEPSNLVILDVAKGAAARFALADRLRSIDKLNRPTRSGAKSSPRVAPAGKAIPKSARGAKIIYTQAVAPIRQRISAAPGKNLNVRKSAVILPFPSHEETVPMAAAA